VKKDKEYWKQVGHKAIDLESDGCTGVPDFYINCCWEHDIHYRTHERLDGSSITRAEADSELRKCIQSKSKLGIFNPMSWWRWAGVRLLAGKAWEKEGEGTTWKQ